MYYGYSIAYNTNISVCIYLLVALFQTSPMTPWSASWTTSSCANSLYIVGSFWSLLLLSLAPNGRYQRHAARPCTAMAGNEGKVTLNAGKLCIAHIPNSSIALHPTIISSRTYSLFAHYSYRTDASASATTTARTTKAEVSIVRYTTQIICGRRPSWCKRTEASKALRIAGDVRRGQ